MMRFNLILAALAVLLAIPTYLTITGEKQRFTEFDTVPRLFDGFTPDSVRFVVLSRRERDENGEPKPAQGEQGPPMERLVFAKSDGTWVLGDGPLAGVEIQAFDDENKVVSDVLEHVASVRRDEKALVAIDASDERLAETDLSEDRGLLIQCLNGNQEPIAEMYVGADASGGNYGEDAVRGRYVRAKDNKAIVLYEVEYWDLSLEADSWIEKMVHDFETTEVKEFAWNGPHGEVRFARDENGTRWTCAAVPEGRGAVRQQEVDNLLARYNRLYCERYVPPSELQGVADLGLQPRPQIRVEAILKDGSSYTLSIGAKIADKNEHYALASAKDGFVLALGDWNRTPFEREIVEFFDPAAPKEGDGQGEGNGGGDGKKDDGGDEGGAGGDGEKKDGDGGNGPR